MRKAQFCGEVKCLQTFHKKITFNAVWVHSSSWPRWRNFPWTIPRSVKVSLRCIWSRSWLKALLFCKDSGGVTNLSLKWKALFARRPEGTTNANQSHWWDWKCFVTELWDLECAPQTTTLFNLMNTSQLGEDVRLKHRFYSIYAVPESPQLKCASVQR